jgi:hypothetical protein
MCSLAVGVANAAAAGQPKAEGFPATFTGSGGAGVLETVAEGTKVRTVNCTGNTSSGEVNSATSVKGVLVKFTGCTTSGPFGLTVPCKSSGASAKEIRTVALKGSTAYLIKSSNRAGIVLSPESGTTFSEFTCTLLGVTVELKVTGSVVGELTPVNTSTTAYSLILKQSAGHQEFENFLSPTNCASTKAVLMTQGKNAETFGPIQSGVSGTESLTMNHAVKVNTNTTDCP